MLLKQRLHNVITTNTDIVIDLANASALGIQVVADVNTPSAAACASASAINATTNVFTKTAHGLTTGLKVQATTSSALPTGLSLATDYFVIALTADTFQLATNLANAQAGTAIDISDAGTGTQTFTPVALAGCSVKTQKSMDGTNWTDAESAVNITADGSTWFAVTAPTYKYTRLYFAITAGRFSADCYFNLIK
jgi:hypothetical protein